MADLSITAANVLPSTSAITVTGVLHSGVTVTQGQALYQYADGTIGLADSNGASPANTFYGIALSAGSPGQKITIATSDTGGFTFGASVSAGDPIYLSNTPGALTKTYSDIASGSTVIVIGGALTSTTINLTPVTYGTKP